MTGPLTLLDGMDVQFPNFFTSFLYLISKLTSIARRPPSWGCYSCTIDKNVSVFLNSFIKGLEPKAAIIPGTSQNRDVPGIIGKAFLFCFFLLHHYTYYTGAGAAEK